jgi:malate dehydrogenase (oxaloacetate-decarboxylating)(NADP+)
MQYGPDYIIPVPFDPRLISTVPAAVAQAAMDSGVARKPIANMRQYKQQLSARLDPTANTFNLIFERVRENPKKVIFSEGEEEKIIQAAVQWRDNGYGTPVLVGREKQILAAMDRMHIANRDGIEITNAAMNPRIDHYVDFLYEKLQRKGYLQRDIARLVKNDRNSYAACMLACGDGDAMITGLTRNFTTSVEGISTIIDQTPGKQVFGLSIVITQRGTFFISDTAVHELPDPQVLADIAEQTAGFARNMGVHPRVALLAFSNFGNPMREKTMRVRDAVNELNRRKVDFEYEGEMSPDVALNPELMRMYPFCRLSGPANVLIMPALHSAHISSYLLQELGGGTVIGPILVGLSKPAQVVQMGATVSQIMNIAAMAAADDTLQHGHQQTAVTKIRNKA